MLSQQSLSKPVQSREYRRDSGAVSYAERQTQKTVRFHSDARPSLSTDDRTSDTAGRSAACARCFGPLATGDRSVGRVGGEGGDSSLVRTRRTAFFVLSPERYFRVQRSVSRGGVLCNLTLTMVLLLLVGLTTQNISSMHGAPFEFERR